jgi:hypothetical protein
MNSMISTSIAAETNANPTACRRFYAIFEDAADEPTAEHGPIPSDLFALFLH